MPPKSKTREEIIAEAKILPFRMSAKRAPDSRSASLRTLPLGTMLVCRCQDCGLERQENVRRLVQEARLGNASILTLGHILTCNRMSCGGELDVEITRD